jgi:hypothetical protein
MIENLYKKKLLKKSHVLTFADFTAKTEADVEDMFDDALYLQLVNDEFSASFSGKLKLKDLTSHAPRILVRIEDYLAKNPMKGGVRFNHYRPARFFAEKVSTLSISNATLERFDAAFKAVNGLLK